jgi:hypothetical protein
MDITEAEVAWVAGVLEGEGYFGVYRARGGSQTRLTVACEMTDEDVIRRLREITGLGSIHVGKTRDPNWKPTWRWSVQSVEGAQEVARAVRPWMGARRTARIDEMLAVVGRQPVDYPHGSLGRYQKRGCRCDECRAENTRVKREARQRPNDGDIGTRP